MPKKMLNPHDAARKPAQLYAIYLSIDTSSLQTLRTDEIGLELEPFQLRVLSENNGPDRADVQMFSLEVLQVKTVFGSAHASGIRDGDCLIHVEGARVTTLHQFRKAIQAIIYRQW